MASIYSTPKSRYWICAFRDLSGKQFRRSTGILKNPYHEDPKERAALAGKARREALAIAAEFEATARGDRTEAMVRKTLGDLFKRATGQEIEFASVRSFLHRWLKRIEQTKSAGTLARYKGTVDAFLASLGGRAEVNLQDITARDIEAFATLRLEGGRSQSTVAVDCKTLNTVFALAMRQGLILTNPVAAADPVKGEKERREPFSVEQVAALIRTASGDWLTAILLGARQGLRLGDAVTLKWSNLDLAEKVIRFRPSKTRGKKKDMVLPFHPDVERHLMTLNPPDNAPDGFLTPCLAKAKPGGRSGLSRQFQAIMSEAGIEQSSIAAGGDAGRIFNKFTFHSLRHTYVTALEAAGVAPDQRMLLAGHADAKSHATYTHTTVATLRAALERIQ